MGRRKFSESKPSIPAFAKAGVKKLVYTEKKSNIEASPTIEPNFHLIRGEVRMDRNIIFFAWNRSIPGREETSGKHFDDFVAYLSAQAQSGAIQGFDVVFLDPHGGDMNGFFLIKGGSANLDALVSTAEWTEHMTRAALHLQGSGTVRGVTGEAVGQRMELWKRVSAG